MHRLGKVFFKNLTQSRNEQLRYLPQSVKMEEAINPHIVRLTMGLISGAILIFILWASFAEVSEIAVAEGEVVPRGFVQVVQHLDGGLVDEILTGEGDVVEEGQVLVRIDDGGARQDLGVAQTLQLSLEMQLERLYAFVEDREPDFSSYKNLDKEVEKQRRIFSSMVNARQKERHVIEDQLAQKREALNTLKARQETLKKNLIVEEEILKMSEEMKGKGSISRKDYLDAQKTVNDRHGELSEVQADLAGAYNALAEYKNRLFSLDAKHYDEAYTHLDKIETEARRNREMILKLKSKVERLDIRSPVHGIIKGLKLNTIGGVVEPGVTIMEILPLDKALVVEARILPSDIGHITVGQKVRVKIRSYDFSRYGAVDGILDFITATTFLDPRGQPYYRGRIILEKSYIGDASHRKIIMPGMTVEANIITGKKTILAYLLKPIHISLRTALHER